MKFALVNGQRVEAQPQLSGECPACGRAMVAKCGEVRVRHWAHKVGPRCDLWSESETEWHRAWKDLFPAEWQEFVQYAQDGERHIADVKTGDGWVLEFQHSYINPEERRSREAYYPQLAWVVNGLRRERDQARFLKSWGEGTQVRADAPARSLWSGEGALLRDWVGSRAHVFFDFGEPERLWWLSPLSDDTWSYVVRVARAPFIEAHLGAAASPGYRFGGFVEELGKLIPAEASRLRSLATDIAPPRPQRDILSLMRERMLRGQKQIRRYRRW